MVQRLRREGVRARRFYRESHLLRREKGQLAPNMVSEPRTEGKLRICAIEMP